MPGHGDESEQEGTQSCFGNGHADNGKALADALVKSRLDNFLGVANLRRSLAETIVGRDLDERRVDD